MTDETFAHFVFDFNGEEQVICIPDPSNRAVPEAEDAIEEVQRRVLHEGERADAVIPDILSRVSDAALRILAIEDLVEWLNVPEHQHEEGAHENEDHD